MSTGIATDFKVYPDQFWGGVVETLQENTELFNAASLNTLRLITRMIGGDYEAESFLKKTANMIRHRDNLSLADVEAVKLAHGEYVGIKVNRGIGPFEGTLDEFKKVSQDPATFSLLIGQQLGKEIASDYVAVAIGAAYAGIQKGSLTYDNTGQSTDTLNHTAMIDGLALMGDAGERVKVWAMHSKPFYDLMKQQVADKLFEVAGATVYAGTIASFGRPVIVSDNASLVVAGEPNVYPVLGLTENSVEVAESESRDIVSQLVTGKENLIMRLQGEYAFNVRVKGCAWGNKASLNPLDATIKNAASWTKVATSDKDLGGIAILVN